MAGLFQSLVFHTYTIFTEVKKDVHILLSSTKFDTVKLIRSLEIENHLMKCLKISLKIIGKKIIAVVDITTNHERNHFP